MRTSIYLSHFLTLLLCIAFPLYLATRVPGPLYEIAVFFSSISKRAAEALLISLAASLSPISKEPAQASTGRVKLVLAPEDERINRYPSSLPDGLAHCINSFERYPTLAEQVLQRKYTRYAKQTPAQKAMSDKLGYHEHFEKARKGIEVNARFLEQIARAGREDYHTGPRALEDNQDAELGLVSTTFGHIHRDWSTQGAEERQAVFPPILAGLEQHFREKNRSATKVLVPGSGLGRLASDIADLGTSILPTSRLSSKSPSHTCTPVGRLRGHSQRARLRLHPSLQPAHEPHELTPPTHATALRDHMGASGQPFLALLSRDSAGPLA